MVRAFRTAVLALAAVAALAAAARAAHILIPGQKAFGTISDANQVDEVWFQADQGAVLTFTVKARKGEDPLLHPVFTRIQDPDGIDLLPSLTVKANAAGTSRKVKFTAPKSGTFGIGISGDEGGTGTWDLVSVGPARTSLGACAVAQPGDEERHPFDADAGSVLTIQVKAAKGSTLHPLVVRVEAPDGGADLDLAAAGHRTAKKTDTLKALAIPAAGTHALVVTGAGATTGAYAVAMKLRRKAPLDFSVDPLPGPPPAAAPAVCRITPESIAIPLSGTESRTITVDGSGFRSGTALSLAAPAGNNGISNAAATVVSRTKLTATFELSDTASPGARSATVTNPDAQSGTRPGALFLTGGVPIITVTSVNPTGGPGAGGTKVLVQGTLFSPAATVTFGGIAARAVNVLDAGNILCIAPPAAALSPTAGTPVGVTVDNGSGDAATLAAGYTYDADAKRPTVAASAPAEGATGVGRNIRKVVLVISEPVAPGPVTAGNFSFFRSASSGPNPGPDDVGNPGVTAVALAGGGRMIVLTRNASPSSLTSTATYIAQVHAGGQTTNLVGDVAGNPLDPKPFAEPVYQASFTTGSGTDLAGPSITATTPAALSVGVVVDAAPTVTFSEAIDPTTLAAAVTLRRGASTVAVDLDLDAACTTATILPRAKLAAASTYTIGVSTALRDLAGNAPGTAFSAGFTTATADSSKPVQVLTVDGLAQDLNGSGNYAEGTSNGGSPAGTGAATPFNVYLPRTLFTLDVAFTDLGGSGADPATFSCTCSRALGDVAAGAELSSLFVLDSLGARWMVDAAHPLPAATDVVFTVNVKDRAGNAADGVALAVDVADITKTISNGTGTPSTDRDPFNSIQSWLLRFDQDIYAVTSTAGGTGSHAQPLTVSSALGSNGVADFEEDLRLIGLNGPMTGTGAATATNGPDTGTNAILRTRVKAALRAFLRMRYGMAADGTRGTTGARIEFLLEGEAKASGGTVAAAGWTSSSGFSMMTFTGDERPNAAGAVIGRANLDLRNQQEDDDSNTGVSNGSNLGAFATHMIRSRINDAASTLFPRTYDPLIALRGGTPAGSDNLDSVVLSSGFSYATGTSAEKARFDLIAKAVDRYALYLSATGAHEIGHSTGLVPDGAPPAGLFGNAHPSNPFIAGAAFTTPNHIDAPGPNLMEAAALYSEELLTGPDLMTFEPLSMAWLLQRLIYDQ